MRRNLLICGPFLLSSRRLTYGASQTIIYDGYGILPSSAVSDEDQKKSRDAKDLASIKCIVSLTFGYAHI